MRSSAALAEMRLRTRLIDALVVLELKRALPQLSECLVGVGDSLGADVAGGSPVGDFLPVGPGEHPLDREYLGGPQSCLNAWAEGARQCLLVLEHVSREPSRQARC